MLAPGPTTGIDTLMFGDDFITVSKKEEYSWDEVNPVRRVTVGLLMAGSAKSFMLFSHILDGVYC